jgi:hypothetical protein
MTERTTTSARDIVEDGADYAEFDGVKVRKGSLGAFVANAKAFQSLSVNDPERDVILAHMRELLPAVATVGAFEVFRLRSPELREALGGAAADGGADV